MTEQRAISPNPPGLRAVSAEAERQADEVLAQYSGWAKAVMRVVEARGLYASIEGKKYLEFEAWQLIGAFDRCYVDTDDVVAISSEDGVITGYMCRAKLIRDGQRAGAAVQICGLDAFPCRGKTGSAKENAAISAAQTWAGSKALKMRYSAVAVLGGYGAATGDEMRRASEEVDRTRHWCEEHETNWFKRGRMKNFAHPTDDAKVWCNEPAVVPVTPVVEDSSPDGSETPPQPASAQSEASVAAAGAPKNVGELLSWAFMNYGMSRVNVLNTLRVPALQDITDLGLAWLTVTKAAEAEAAKRGGQE